VTPTRGEVWWHEPPDDEPRPFVILTRNEAIAGLEKLVAVPTTQTIRGIPSEVELGHDDGMPGDCVVSTDNITVVRKMLLTRHITTLSPSGWTKSAAHLPTRPAAETEGGGSLARAVQVGVELRRRLVLVARHQVAVEVERDLDARVAHVRREGLRVDPGPRCSSKRPRRIAGIGTRRSLPDFVAISPTTASGLLDMSIPLVGSLPGGPDVAVVQFRSTLGPLHLHYREHVHGHIVEYEPKGVPLPDKCPHSGFRFLARFAFQNGSHSQAAATVPCPPRHH
jgi:mRNA interferase MazF